MYNSQNKSPKKDIIISCLIISTDGLYYIWGLIYPYLISYYSHHDQNIKMKDGFRAFLNLFLGRIVGNWILPFLIFKFGCKNTIRMGSVLYFFVICNYILIPYKWNLYLNSFFLGLSHQFKILPINYLISKKYENGIDFLKYIYSGFSFALLIWSFLCWYLFYSKNLGNGKINLNGFYVYSISKNIIWYFLINGVFSLIVIFLSTIFLKEFNKKIPFNTELSEISFCSEYSKSNKSEKSEKTSKSSIKYDKNDISISLSVESESQNNNKMDLIELKKIANQKMKELKFIMIIFIIIIKYASCSYFTSNAKYMSSFFIKNDKLIFLMFILSGIFDLLARYFISNIMNNHGFFRTMCLSFFISIFSNIIYVLFGYNSQWVFIFVFFFQSMVFATQYLLCNMFLFHSYNPEIALFLSRFYEIYAFFYFLYDVGLNEFFVREGEFRYLFLIFIFGEIIGLVVFYKNFKKMEIHHEKYSEIK